MSPVTVMLVDNGSSRPESTLNLRRLAALLGEAAGREVSAVSLQHAQRIPAHSLDGIPAQTFRPFMERRLAMGERRFLLLPLFFGPSRALSSFIPDQTAELRQRHGEFLLHQAPVLCPLPEGEPRLAAILFDQLMSEGIPRPSRVILVDHGSPLSEVTAVRGYLAEQLSRLLGPEYRLEEAVMERREGAAYDFNGELLERVLERNAEGDDQGPLALSLLFMSPGRHAGAGGDIETICARIRQRHPALPLCISRLVGEHDGLIPILLDRLDVGLRALTSSPVPGDTESHRSGN